MMDALSDCRDLNGVLRSFTGRVTWTTLCSQSLEGKSGLVYIILSWEGKTKKKKVIFNVTEKGIGLKTILGFQLNSTWRFLFLFSVGFIVRDACTKNWLLQQCFSLLNFCNVLVVNISFYWDYFCSDKPLIISETECRFEKKKKKITAVEWKLKSQLF